MRHAPYQGPGKVVLTVKDPPILHGSGIILLSHRYHPHRPTESHCACTLGRSTRCPRPAPRRTRRMAETSDAQLKVKLHKLKRKVLDTDNLICLYHNLGSKAEALEQQVAQLTKAKEEAEAGLRKQIEATAAVQQQLIAAQAEAAQQPSGDVQVFAPASSPSRCQPRRPPARSRVRVRPRCRSAWPTWRPPRVDTRRARRRRSERCRG